MFTEALCEVQLDVGGDMSRLSLWAYRSSVLLKIIRSSKPVPTHKLPALTQAL